MSNFNHLELAELIDLLSKYTARYTKMLSEGINTEEFVTCKSTIRSLQSEIEVRKSAKTNDRRFKV